MSKWAMGKRVRFGGAGIVLAASLALAGCGGSSAVTMVEGKTNVISSFYPLAYMAEQIGGEHVNSINLIPAGVEPHDWTPRARERKAMGDADVILYNGAGLEGWIDDVLGSLEKDSKTKIVEATAGLDLIHHEDKEELSAGKQEDDHDHEHEEDEHKEDEHGHDDHDHGHSHEIDPHVWVSPKQAIRLADNVLKGLVEADPAHRTDYETNHAKLTKTLQELDAKYTAELQKVARKEIVVTHDAFSYLARDYGLKQAALMGLSPDAEPKAQDIKAINEFVKEHGVKYIFFEELVSDKLAKTLAKDAGIETLVLNPLEGLTEEQTKAGATYVSLLETNLQNLLKALQ